MFRTHRAFALALLVFVSGAGAAELPTHSDSTRQWLHTSDNGQGLAAMHVGDPGTRGFKDPAQTLRPKVKADTQRSSSAETTLVQSITTVGVEGWTTVKADNGPASVQLGADIGKGVVGSDANGESWYFLAPGDKFSGDLSRAYNGRLMLTLVHAETPSGGSVRREPDVILEATCGHSLMLYNFASKSGDLSVMLNEDAGWIDSRTKSAPGAMDFLGVLSHLAAVKVRGGYYAGAESTRLSAVSVTAGKEWFPCCTLDGTVDLCQKKPSSYYNPAGLKFYCEGHLYKPVKVTRVLPRFGRRTGGSIVTVIGENFGLSGSNPIVRINGRACQRTSYAPSVVRDESQSDSVSTNMYSLLGTGTNVVGASNLAGNALINAYNSATDSMKQQYPEHCWNGMQDDGTDKGFNYGTAATAKYINQGETGIDTGGPCFPAHCSSCTVPTADSADLKNLGAHARCSAGNQIAAVASGRCKGRGSESVLCAFNFPYLKYPHLCPEDAPYSSRLKKAYTFVHYSDAAGFGWDAAKGKWADVRRDFGHRRWNRYGMFANVDGKKEPVEGVTRVTHLNPQMGTASFGKTTVKTGSYLVNASTTLWVNGACQVLLGQNVTTGNIACGSDSVIAVTAAVDKDDNGDGVFDSCELTVTVDAVGANAPGTVGMAQTTCQSGSPVWLHLASPAVAASFSESGTFVHVEDALGLCGLNFKPLGPSESGAATDFTLAGTGTGLTDRVQGATTVKQAATLTNTATTLDVTDVKALMGDETAGWIQCGNDYAIEVTGVAGPMDAANPNRLTITQITATGGLCHTGAPVRRMWVVELNLTDVVAKADMYFHATRDADSFGVPSHTDPAYVMIYDKTKEVNGEIVKVVGIKNNNKLIVSERGQFGTPVSAHVAVAHVVAVEVCRGAAVRLGPAAATGANHFTAAILGNAECHGYDGPTATDGRYCRLRVAQAADLLKAVRVGDVARRVAQGRTKVAAKATALINGIADQTLKVESAAELMAVQATQKPGEGALADANFFVSCGGDTTLLVEAVNFATNTLTISGAANATGTLDALGGANDASNCVAGSIVTVVRGVAQLQIDASSREIQIKGRCEYLLGGPPVKQTDNKANVSLDVSSRGLKVACGGNPAVAVTAVKVYDFEVDLCTLTTTTDILDTAGNPGHTACTANSWVYNANIGTFPAHHEYTTTFDVLSTAELSTSDVAEFSRFRYVKIDDEIMRILDLADGDTAEATKGYERLTVARAQLGTLAAPHDRDAVVTLLPRITELSTAVTIDADTLYLPSAADLIANNINVGVKPPTAARQVGGTVTAYYIKVDDEIMKILASNSVSQSMAYAPSTADGAKLTVLRAQKGTLVTGHAAGAPVFVLGCMDSDETGSNCGGSCKPCSARAKGGPVQQEKLLCVTPVGESGAGPSGQGAGDLSVTVEAEPGPRESPFRARMAPRATGWLDASATAVSCISEQNRGFQYGAHDFVWGVHFASAAQAEEVKVLDMAVDHNTGETYMVGTMRGTITLQGKHIAMNKGLLGKLSVGPATGRNVNMYLEGTATAPPTPTVLTAAANTVVADKDYIGATAYIYDSDGAEGYGCMGTVLDSANTDVLTIDTFKRKDGDCVFGTALSKYRLYHGKMSFIAKFSKDGKPMWLNKVDAGTTTALATAQAEITSIAVDPAAGTHYVVGTFSDGLVKTATAQTANRAMLNIYSVNAATREAAAVPAASVKTLGTDSYGQIATDDFKEGAHYQQGFLIKYSSAGQYLVSEAIKGRETNQSLVVENLKVRAFHASTSNQINTQVPKDGPAPTERTKTSRNDVEYDRGVAVSAVQGGGTEERSSITLSRSAATYFQAVGQDLAGTGSVMDDWYNGLTLTITCGKGMGQSRTIQDYNAATRTAYVQPHWSGNGEMTPDATSCYSISGKPSSHVHGEHWVNGGIYVTGRLVSGPAVANKNTVCFGQMPDAYKSTSGDPGIPVCTAFKGIFDAEELNFVAQYDNMLRTFWVRFLYDGKAGTSMGGAGDITAVTATDDMVFVTGTFGYHAVNNVLARVAIVSEYTLRLQNCTFDTATVSHGPPVNSKPTVTTLKKVCRSQAVTSTLNSAQEMNKLLPGETVQKLEGGEDTYSGVSAAESDYVVQNTVPEDYVEILAAQGAASPETSLMFTAAYDASGRLVWYHYTRATGPNDGTDLTGSSVEIKPTAMTFVRPAIGNKPLTGYWKTLSDTEQVWTSRGQPPDATAAKDIGSERVDSATVKGGFIYIVGTIKSLAADKYADFGVTKYPLECSQGKTLGKKGQDLRLLGGTPCAGKIQSSGTTPSTDVFLVKFAARGAPRTNWTMTEYSTSSVQPALQWIRRTGLIDKDDTATGVAVHDLTGAIFVTGTYLSMAATQYQGSDVGEKRYLASPGNDGGNVYKAQRSASLALNSGNDVFGLKAAGRVNAIGCPMQRTAPADEHEERMGLTGIPDCTFYAHAGAVDKPTGFVVKFNDNGDETQRGNKNSKFQRSITGFVQTSISDNDGYTTSIAPCAGTAGTTTHVLMGSALCSTSPRGCSCLVLKLTSKTGGTLDAADSSDPRNQYNGMRIRITSGKAAGYDGIISAYKGEFNVFNTIPALPEMPDEHSQFALQPWSNLQPNVHLANCAQAVNGLTLEGMGCKAYGVEWAKTIGWPIGQSKVTPNNPTNVQAGVPGPWRAIGTGGTAGTATTLILNKADEVKAQGNSFWKGYWVELSTQSDDDVKSGSGPVASAVARANGTATAPTDANNGGKLTIACPDVPAGCPTGVTRYRLIAKSDATKGIEDLESKGTYQTSMPASVAVMDSDVYISGHFKGFDRFRFGIEGVDETVGYRSVGDDTWETYLVKLSD